MSDPDPPIDPDVLAALRAPEAPPEAVRARAHARLVAAIPGFAGARPPPGSSGGGGSPGGAAGLLGGHGLALAAFVLGGGVGAAVYATVRPPPVPSVVYVYRDPPAASSVASMTSAPSPDAVEGPSAIAIAPPPVPPAAPSMSRATQLAAERTLLDEARAGLLSGAPATALERAQRHRRLFPHPLLGEERDAMEIEALGSLGRTAEARARADAFRRGYPRSLFLATVDGVIGAAP